MKLLIGGHAAGGEQRCAPPTAQPSWDIAVLSRICQPLQLAGHDRLREAVGRFSEGCADVDSAKDAPSLPRVACQWQQSLKGGRGSRKKFGVTQDCNDDPAMCWSVVLLKGAWRPAHPP